MHDALFLPLDHRSINTFVSNQPDGSGTRLGLRNNIPLTNSQGSISAVAGITTQIQNVASNVDLSNIDCSEFQYFCAELTKSSNPSMNFDIVPPRSVTCVQVNCNGERKPTINICFCHIFVIKIKSRRLYMDICRTPNAVPQFILQHIKKRKPDRTIIYIYVLLN